MQYVPTLSEIASIFARPEQLTDSEQRTLQLRHRLRELTLQLNLGGQLGGLRLDCGSRELLLHDGDVAEEGMNAIEFTTSSEACRRW